MNRKAQGTTEYFVFLSLIIAGLITTQVYLKRGMQGRLKSYVEQLNEGVAYSPGATNSNHVISRNVSETSNSTTICRDANGTEINCYTLPESERKKIRVSGGSAAITQQNRRLEEILPFAGEPQRW